MQISLKIKSITVRPVAVPMEPPHRTASGVISESPLVLTDVCLEDGSVGHSLIFTFTRMALLPTAELIRNMEPLLVDRILDPGAIEQELSRRFRLLGTQGLLAMAMAAIDMALWDALARVQGKSLVDLLKGTAKPIPAYGGVGYEGALGSAKAAERWVAQGFRGVKAKIGYPAVEEDLEVVRAMRQAVGDDVAIMVDYNQSLSCEEAIRRLGALEQEGLSWVEEPTLAHDYKGHARIAREIETPIQCGENWWGAMDMQHAVDARASDYMMPDVMKIGGVTGWMRAAELGRKNSIQLSSHLWPEVSAQLLCITPTCHWLEYADWWNPVLAQPLTIAAGCADVAGAVGSGVTWNEKAVGRYLV